MVCGISNNNAKTGSFWFTSLTSLTCGVATVFPPSRVTNSSTGTSDYRVPFPLWHNNHVFFLNKMKPRRTSALMSLVLGKRSSAHHFVSPPFVEVIVTWRPKHHRRVPRGVMGIRWCLIIKLPFLLVDVCAVKYPNMCYFFISFVISYTLLLVQNS